MELHLIELAGEKFLGLPIGILLRNMKVLIVPEEPVHCDCTYCKTGRYYKLKEKIMKSEVRFPMTKELLRGLP